MNNKLKIVSLLVAIVYPSSCHAQSKAQLLSWVNVVKLGSLNEIDNKMGDSSFAPWPKIISPFAAEQLPLQAKEMAISADQLAGMLLDNISKNFVRDSNPSFIELSHEVMLCNSLSEHLRQADGYGNLVLADTLFRLALFRISGWLIFHPDDMVGSEKLCSLLSPNRIDAIALLYEMYDQDPKLKSLSANFSKGYDGKNWYDTLNLIGANAFDALEPVSSRMLLNKANVIALITHMAQSNSMINVDIKGTICFFQKGGQYQELNSKDIRPFKARMGKDANRFNDPFLQRKSFAVSDVLHLIVIHKDSEMRNSFLDTILR